MLFAGIVSDRWGRRNVYTLGLTLLAVGYVLVPTCTTVEALWTVRAVWALGMASATSVMAIILVDYLEDESRGKGAGIMGAMNGIGSALGATVGARFPDLALALGIYSPDGTTQAWFSFLLVAAICLIGAAVARFGLAGKATQVASDEEAPPSIKELTVKGLGAGRKDYFIWVAYVSAFVSRSDLAMIGLFAPQWAASLNIEEAKRHAIENSWLCTSGTPTQLEDSELYTSTPGHVFYDATLPGAAPYVAPYIPADGTHAAYPTYFNATRTPSATCPKTEAWNNVTLSISGFQIPDVEPLYTGYYALYNYSRACAASVDAGDLSSQCRHGFSCCTCNPAYISTYPDGSKNWKHCDLTKEYLAQLSQDGAASGGALIGIAGAAAIVIAAPWGALVDRYNRLLMVTLGLLVGAVGYGSTIFVYNIAEGGGYASLLIIGMGEVTGVIATQAFIQERASRAEQRDPGISAKGSVIGMFNLCGGLGVLVNSKVGGVLFKIWTYGASHSFFFFFFFFVPVEFVFVCLSPAPHTHLRLAQRTTNPIRPPTHTQPAHSCGTRARTSLSFQCAHCLFASTRLWPSKNARPWARWSHTRRVMQLRRRQQIVPLPSCMRPTMTTTKARSRRVLVAKLPIRPLRSWTPHLFWLSIPLLFLLRF